MSACGQSVHTILKMYTISVRPKELCNVVRERPEGPERRGNTTNFPAGLHNNLNTQYILDNAPQRGKCRYIEENIAARRAAEKFRGFDGGPGEDRGVWGWSEMSACGQTVRTIWKFI